MSKSWSLFSIVVVFALLILLAPAAILLPGGNAVQAQCWDPVENVTQAVNANFSFTEAAGGGWHSFTAGSGGIQGLGLTLEQYTREYVLLNATLSGCEFRNYTTGSGNAAGDLVGTMSLAWLTFKFNQTYPNTTLTYNTTAANGTNFGWMSGRGHFYGTNPNDNFTFVFILDFDSDETLTNAKGKGFMVSVEENGIFGNMTNPVEERHKIIGDFDVVKSGSNYTWDLHLRNYPPNEVYNRGNVTVEGGVMQELTDDINHTPVVLLNFTQDGPEVTSTDVATGFEEIHWGKDPIKTVTGGPLGSGGDMDLTRNGALYLEVNAGENWVHIEASEVCMLHIDDTYAVTGDDGSTYGHAYYYLALYLPYQELDVGDFFEQDGYTWYPFGMHLKSTDCYAGAETFALAHIGIESSVGNSTQFSVDKSYALYPHPVVTAIAPNNGNPGQTLNVTINGKYFLRADGEKSGGDPSSGSVSFSCCGITVNNYTVDSAEQITANITINSTICAGPRDVTVTSCFGYASGSGTDPYMSGVKDDAFTVTGGTGTLEGKVDFDRKEPKGGSTWVTPLVVKFFDNATKAPMLEKCVTTNNQGNFTIPNVGNGTYDIGIKNYTCLSKMVYGIAINSTAVINFGTPIETDGDNNDWCEGKDYGKVFNNFGARVISDPDGWAAKELWKCDFYKDGWIEGHDYNQPFNNFGKRGDIFYYTH